MIWINCQFIIIQWIRTLDCSTHCFQLPPIYKITNFSFANKASIDHDNNTARSIDSYKSIQTKNNILVNSWPVRGPRTTKMSFINDIKRSSFIISEITGEYDIHKHIVWRPSNYNSKVTKYLYYNSKGKYSWLVDTRVTDCSLIKN